MLRGTPLDAGSCIVTCIQARSFIHFGCSKVGLSRRRWAYNHPI
jgi:hypothetical protein